MKFHGASFNVNWAASKTEKDFANNPAFSNFWPGLKQETRIARLKEVHKLSKKIANKK